MAVEKDCDTCLFDDNPRDYGACRNCTGFSGWKQAVRKTCLTCLHVGKLRTNYPCDDCDDYNKWEQIVDKQPKIEGVHPDMPVVTNEQGGKQSDSPYCWTDLDPTAMLEIAKRSGGGRKKYGEGNWLKIDWKEHLNHALTHIYAWLAGDTQDNHPAAAAWRVIAALGVYLKSKGE